MRIVEVTYSWPAETFIARHALALHESPYPVDLTIASKSPVQPLSASVNESGPVPFHIASLPNFDYFGQLRKLREGTRTLGYRAPRGTWHTRDKAVLRTLSTLKPDLVHFHFGSLAVMMAHYPRALGIPYSVSLRGSDIQVMPLRDEQYAARLCEVLELASGVHAVCEDIAQLAQQRCPSLESVTVIRTCVPLPEKVAPFLNVQGRLHFVTAGRLHWRKAYPDLIRSMNYLPNASLDIVGDGPEYEHLLYLIHCLNLESRVRLVGKLPFSEFLRLLQQATAYVQSSIAEGFSNALAEAMALGKAGFATDVGGTAEVIEDGRNGIIIPAGDPAGISRKLRLAADANLMQHLGRAARQTAVEMFSMERHAREFHAFYQLCLS